MNRLNLGILLLVAVGVAAAVMLFGWIALAAVVILGGIGATWHFGLFKKKETFDVTEKAKFTHHDLWRIVGLVIVLGLAAQADWWVGALFLGTLAFLLALPWVLPYFPGLVQALSNNPNEFRPKVETTPSMSRVEKAKQEANVGSYEPSTLAFFTFIKPGRIKAIVRGERFQRFIMKFDGMTFSGEQQFKVNEAKEVVSIVDEDKRLQRNQREYWDVEKNKTGKIDNDSHPIPLSLRKGVLDMTWLWSRHVYELTGAVFTGIPPFQTVEVYELEQLVKVISSESGDEGEFVFVSWKDYSDHVRAAEFQFFVQVPGAETKDQVKVRLQFALTVMIENPYRAFYETDNRWASRLFTAVVQEVSANVRALSYKEVIAADKNVKSARNPLLKPILRLNADATGIGSRAAAHDIGEIGLKIKGAELIDAEVADAKLAEALADVARSKADEEARKNRANAEAYAVDNVAAAARKHGEYGRLALTVEGNVRTAAAATKDGGDVILNIDGTRGEQVDPRTAFLRKSISGGSE